MILMQNYQQTPEYHLQNNSKNYSSLCMDFSIINFLKFWTWTFSVILDVTPYWPQS